MVATRLNTDRRSETVYGGFRAGVSVGSIIIRIVAALSFSKECQGTLYIRVVRQSDRSRQEGAGLRSGGRALFHAA